MNPGLFLQIVIILSTSLDKSECLKPIWGVYYEQLQDPLFYKTNIPLVYEFQYLDEKFEQDQLTPTFNYCASNSAYCPIENDESNIVKTSFPQDFESYSPTLFEKIWPKSEGIQDKRNFCDKIQNNLPTFISNYAWSQYLDQMRNCSLGHLMWSEKTNYLNFTLMNRQFFVINNRYLEKILPELIKLEGNTLKTHSTYFIFKGNFELGLQGTILHTYYARRNRIIQAIAECRQGRIPASLIKIENFEKNLKNLVMRLSSTDSGKKLDLLINVHPISKFYSLPLVDCSQTERSLVIKISIPVKETTKSKLVLQKIYPISYTYGGKICQLKLPSPEDQNYLIFEGNVHLSTCMPNSLCQNASLGPIDNCLTSINSKLHKNLKPFCKFQCIRQTIGFFNWPIVLQTSTDLFIVSGYGHFKIICSTDDSHFERKIIKMNRDFVGAHEIKLPCRCSIEVYPENYQNFSVQLPAQVYKSVSTITEGCNKNWHNLEIRQIIPAHFLLESYFAKNINIDQIRDYFSPELADYYTQDRDYDQILHDCQEKSNSNGNAVLVLSITLLLVFSIFGVTIGWIVWEMKMFRNGFEYLRNQNQKKLFQEISKKEAEAEAETEFISLN